MHVYSNHDGPLADGYQWHAHIMLHPNQIFYLNLLYLNSLQFFHAFYVHKIEHDGLHLLLQMWWLQRHSKNWRFLDIPFICRPLSHQPMDILQTAKYNHEQAAFTSKLWDAVDKKLALCEESSKLSSKVHHTSKTNTCLLLLTSAVFAARFENTSRFERGIHSLGMFVHSHRWEGIWPYDLE